MIHSIAHAAMWFCFTLGSSALVGGLVFYGWAKYVVVSTENYDIRMNMDMPLVVAFAGFLWLLGAAALRCL